MLTAEERTIEISNLPKSFFHVENEKKVGCAVLKKGDPRGVCEIRKQPKGRGAAENESVQGESTDTEIYDAS